MIPLDSFVILAEPSRRRILDQLRSGEKSVNDLVERLSINQPGVSKHLRILKDAGFVSSRVSAQQRIYRLESRQLRVVDAWLRPYRKMWEKHLDALESHLNKRKI